MWQMCGFFACKFILTQCTSIVSKRREGCKGRERGTQTAEMAQIKFIAAVMPLEVLQRHSNGRNQTNQAYCRRSAPGGPPAALKRQKTNKSSKLPLKCPWTTSSGTQTAANPQIIPKPPNRLNNYKKRYLASLCDACSFPVCRQ